MKTPWTDYGISRSNYYKHRKLGTLPAKINGTDRTTGITYTETTLGAPQPTKEQQLESFNKALPIVRKMHSRIKRHNAVADGLSSADSAAAANLINPPFGKMAKRLKGKTPKPETFVSRRTPKEVKFTKAKQAAALAETKTRELEDFKKAMEQQAIGIREVRERAAMYRAKAKAKREATKQRVAERTDLANKCYAYAQICATTDKATPAVMKALLREAANLLQQANKALCQ